MTRPVNPALNQSTRVFFLLNPATAVIPSNSYLRIRPPFTPSLAPFSVQPYPVIHPRRSIPIPSLNPPPNLNPHPTPRHSPHKTTSPYSLQYRHTLPYLRRDLAFTCSNSVNHRRISFVILVDQVGKQNQNTLHRLDII